MLFSEEGVPLVRTSDKKVNWFKLATLLLTFSTLLVASLNLYQNNRNNTKYFVDLGEHDPLGEKATKADWNLVPRQPGDQSSTTCFDFHLSMVRDVIDTIIGLTSSNDSDRFNSVRCRQRAFNHVLSKNVSFVTQSEILSIDDRANLLKELVTMNTNVHKATMDMKGKNHGDPTVLQKAMDTQDPIKKKLADISAKYYFRDEKPVQMIGFTKQAATSFATPVGKNVDKACDNILSGFDKKLNESAYAQKNVEETKKSNVIQYMDFGNVAGSILTPIALKTANFNDSLTVQQNLNVKLSKIMADRKNYGKDVRSQLNDLNDFNGLTSQLAIEVKAIITKKSNSESYSTATLVSVGKKWLDALRAYRKHVIAKEEKYRKMSDYNLSSYFTGFKDVVSNDIQKRLEDNKLYHWDKTKEQVCSNGDVPPPEKKKGDGDKGTDLIDPPGMSDLNQYLKTDRLKKVN